MHWQIFHLVFVTCRVCVASVSLLLGILLSVEYY
jgi:hypothetical protein